MGYILDIQEQVNFEQKRSFVLTCARYFVPEDTAFGRQSWHSASDIFFALENSVNEPGKYQLLTQKLEVDDLGSVIQSFVDVDGRPFILFLIKISVDRGRFRFPQLAIL